MEIENEKICTCIAQILHLLNSLIITFLDDDKTETGQSFVYIDGFLVKKHNNQHTIVNFETYKNKMKVSDRRKFEKANFDEFESALNNKNDLVHCPSITLFESIPTEVRSFYEDEKSGLIKVVKFRTGAMDRKRSFEKVVISVMVGKNVKKFLTFVEDEPDFQGGPIPSNTNATTNASTNATTNSSTNATTTASTNVRTSATTTASTNVRTSATTTASINVRTSATTTESTNSSTNATTTESTNSNTSATTTESTNSNTSATTTESTNSNTSATTTESTNSNTSATTTASTNSSTNATTTESTNSNTNATTTESTNSSTNATTTESTNSNTNAATTESTNSNTSATTTESTNSNTSATTTASTNSSTNATNTESTNASAKEDANKDGNAEDNRFHPVTDINKESYKRKGSQMVLLERKKLKAQFPNTSENMNVLQFLGFRSDEIKHLFLYGIDIYFCPEGVFTQYGLCKGCQKMFELCVCWAGQKVSYRRIAWEALAVERMLRNDEEYKEYLEDIEPYHGDPVGYLKYFSVKRREIYSQIQRNYAWYLAITRRRETISVLDSTRGKQGSQVFRMSGRQIKELYYKVWSNLRESKTEVLQYFLNWDEKKCQEEWEAKDDTVFVEALEKVGVFQRLRSMTSAGLQGPQYVKLQFSRHHRQLRSRYELSLGMHLRDQIALGVTPSKVPDWTAFLSMLIGLFYNKTFRQKLEYLLEQISEVWLLPHWLDLANVEVLAADNTKVPLYMLMVAVHKELDSDDVPDGRFDILLCRDSSREVGE
ncbi:CLN_G0023060.mRNA.1.CDS.1 [Saccharomyces cerevisiae]|nr:CLN_G0023060.mRNA.1.CDS.1 [Saccharomyces cerevisiae]CAI7324067.1 CLN_G0023060.mRNA.1.CDS.1 [Saccharomyces cerevisiae]